MTGNRKGVLSLPGAEKRRSEMSGNRGNRPYVI